LTISTYRDIIYVSFLQSDEGKERLMIKSYKEFEKWVKIEMIRQELTQRKLAERMGIAYPRISEALHGRKTGLAFIVPLIQELGGNMEEFEEFLEINQIGR